MQRIHEVHARLTTWGLWFSHSGGHTVGGNGVSSIYRTDGGARASSMLPDVWIGAEAAREAQITHRAVATLGHSQEAALLMLAGVRRLIQIAHGTSSLLPSNAEDRAGITRGAAKMLEVQVCGLPPLLRAVVVVYVTHPSHQAGSLTQSDNRKAAKLAARGTQASFCGVTARALHERLCHVDARVRAAIEQEQSSKRAA